MVIGAYLDWIKGDPVTMKYDYELQVWYDGNTGIIQPCAHPASMRSVRPCCHAWEYRGATLNLARHCEAAKPARKVCDICGVQVAGKVA